MNLAAVGGVRWIPNLLSLLRVALGLCLLPAAVAQEQGIFWILLIIGLVSDALDGLLARAWHATSDVGRKLDSAGDYVLVLALFPSLALLWPDLIRRELAWFAIAILAYFLPTIWSVLRWHTVPGLHTWSAKAAAVGMALALPIMLLGGSPVPFRVFAGLYIFVAAEEFAILRVLPGWSGAMPSLRHARRQTR